MALSPGPCEDLSGVIPVFRFKMIAPRQTFRIRLRKAVPEDLDQLAGVLSDAFQLDPHLQWLIRRDSKSDAARYLFFRQVLTRLPMPQNEIYTTHELSAAAVWFPPNRWKLPLSLQLSSLPELIEIIGWRSFLTRMLGIQIMESHHPKSPHYYLFLLGTTPDFRGLGIAGALLQSMLHRCDQERMPAYLETANETNVGYYARFGFQTLKTIQMPFSGGLKLWLMWREPKRD